jgi:solute carrier family 25 carnitine/acylcarnitine transporter 20/29
MRLWPSSTTTTATVLALSSIVHSQQQPIVSIASTTLVDALSADTDYTSLLRLLQRARLIPTLNKLNGSTLFAPTNDAIKRHPAWHSALTDEIAPLNDNIHEQLRQDLFYHLLNYSIPGLPSQPETQVHKTLLFPRAPIREPPTNEPPPSPPWLPEPGGMLGGEPQRVRVASREGGAWVGVDAYGNGGAQIVKGQVNVRNGVLLGISDVLSVPQGLGLSPSKNLLCTWILIWFWG